MRVVYEQLSKDPNSLSNLDQDLPNYAQHSVPIHSLPMVSFSALALALCNLSWLRLLLWLQCKLQGVSVIHSDYHRLIVTLVPLNFSGTPCVLHTASSCIIAYSLCWIRLHKLQQRLSIAAIIPLPL